MIYLDNNATTPLDPRVLEAMIPYFTEHFGNAASRTHLFGWKAQEAVEIARKQVANLLKATDKEIIFTSGATESNNLAIKGLFEVNRSQKKHIVTLQTEHKAVLDTCQHLERQGAEVTYLKPNPEGIISLEEVENAIRPDTFLVSIMWANNELGVIQPIVELADLCQKKTVFFHTDATQAVGKIDINLQQIPIDLLSLSAHKLYGPKGIGVLFVSRRNPKLKLEALLDGGKHERGLRSGTLNVPGIVGLGKASEIAQREMPTEQLYLAQMRDELEDKILANIRDCQLNGHKINRLPNVSNVSFGGIDGEALLMNLNQIAVSSGSACTSALVEPSYVLKALGLSDDLALATIRFSWGRFNTPAQVPLVYEHLKKTLERMREG
jgi:cysteine desulfurase